MSTLVTRTKIVVPRRPANLLTRERLVDLLLDLLDYRLVLVLAPAGYGKTSVLIDFAHSADLPICWYALDEMDQDPRRFIAHFIASISHSFPSFGAESEAVLNAPDDLDTDQLLQVIVNEAYQHIREHFVIILDDYHLVAEDRTIAHFISRFVQLMDENCHVFLSSRTNPQLPCLPTMAGRSQVGGLSLYDLTFRADEIQALMRQNYQLSLSASDAENLVQANEGWITGLLLSAQIPLQGARDRARLARVSGVSLEDYLAQVAYDQQPASVRDFLLRTSLLEEFSADLCTEVLGPLANWRELMETVLQANLFVLSVGDDKTWLRYHAIFRDFLQARMAQTYPEEHKRILRRMVVVYSEHGEWDEAYRACTRLDDLPTKAGLIEQAGWPLVKSGRMTTLAQWIDDLPASLLALRPELLSLRGIAASMLGEVRRGLSQQNQAEAAFRSTEDLPNLARTLARRAVDHRLLANYQASLADADEAFTLASRDEPLRDIQAEALRAKGVSLARMGRLNEASACLAQSLQIYESLDDAPRVALLCMELGLAHMIAGRYDQTFMLYHRAFDHWSNANDINQQANVLNNLGVLEHLQGYYERAARLLEEAVDCARKSGYARIEALAVSSIGDLYADLDAVEAALDAFRQAREVAQRIDYKHLLFYLDLAEAALNRGQGDLARARVLLESAQRRAQASGSSSELAAWQAEAGHLALAEGNLQAAMTHLNEAIPHFVEGEQRIEGARACLYLAAACQANGDWLAVVSNLQRAFRLVAELESRHLLIVAGRQVKSLLENARNDPEIGQEATRLLSQVVQFEQDIPTVRRRLRQRVSAVPFVPPHLTFKALGRVEVTVRGQIVTNKEWEAQAARDLLFCLLAHPDGLTNEQIGALFWPDKSPARLSGQLKKTMYRLRRKLGKDTVPHDQDLYRFNQAVDYEYDVTAFEEKLKEARLANDPAEKMAAYQAAIDLYAGPYLPDVDAEWANLERERLRQALLTAVLALAQLYFDERQYESVIDYGQRILAEDPCHEQAHRLVMRAYAALDDLVAVTRQFERCQEILSEEVGMTVSPQTRALYKRLTHQ